MAEWRNQVIYISLAVAESVWLYALLVVIGLTFGLESAPLPWLAVLGIVGGAMFTAWLLGGVRGDLAGLAITYGVAGVIAVYLTVGATIREEGAVYNGAWIASFFGRDLSGRDAAAIIISFLASVWFWKRGAGMVADNREPAEFLRRDFKFGLLIVALAVILENVFDEDAGVGILAFPFFAATLAGMGFSRLPASSSDSPGWVRLILVSVAGVIGLGVLAGFLSGSYGRGGLNLVVVAWGWFVDALLWVLQWPIAGLVWLITHVLEWLRNLFDAEPVDEIESPAPAVEPSTAEQAAEGMGNATVESILNILQWPLTIVLIIALFFVLALAYRRLVTRPEEDPDTDRESIRDGADAMGDMARLLKGLMPGWMFGRRGAARMWRWPDEPGVGEVFRLYFEAVVLGSKRGMRFDPNVTPSERVPALSAALPGAPVEALTERFNAACYGHVPTRADVLDRLASDLRASAAATPETGESGEP